MIRRTTINLTWYSSFIWITFHYSLLTNAFGRVIFFKAIWAFLTSVVVASTTPLALTSNYFATSVWSMVILSPLIIVLIFPSFVDSQVRKNHSNRSDHGTTQWIVNKPPTLARSAHCLYLDPIQIHWSILCISFASIGAHFWVTLASELPPSTCSFPWHLIMYLE
jgi:hypothetical protein